MQPTDAHLWAVMYDDPQRAEQVRAEVVGLAGAQLRLLLLDIAILFRHADGLYTLDRKPFPVTGNILASKTLDFVLGVALAAPMTTAAVGALHRELEAGAVLGGGDRVRALRGVTVLGGQLHVHVLAGPVTGPARHVEHEGARGRGLVFGRVEGGDAPVQSPWYRCSRHGSP